MVCKGHICILEITGLLLTQIIGEFIKEVTLKAIVGLLMDSKIKIVSNDLIHLTSTRNFSK